MRLKESIKLTRSCNGEKIDKLPGNKKKHIEDIPIRVIEVILDDGSKEYLIYPYTYHSMSGAWFSPDPHFP